MRAVPLIRVMCIEDDMFVRENIERALDNSSRFVCMGAYSDAESALRELKRLSPDIVLVDLGLPGMSGLDAIDRISDQFPSVGILVLSVQDDQEIIFEALCAGACGYLVKYEPMERILAAIAEAHEGGSPMSSNVARLVVRSFKNSRDQENTLTSREKEVLSVLCSGKSYQSAADDLGISVDTIRGHIRQIYKKLQVHSKAEAVALAIRNRIV